MATKRLKQAKPLELVGLAAVDRLDQVREPHLQDYIDAVSAYVCHHGELTAGKKKAAQIRLSGALGRILLSDLSKTVPGLAKRGYAGERKVAGALRARA